MLLRDTHRRRLETLLVPGLDAAGVTHLCAHSRRHSGAAWPAWPTTVSTTERPSVTPPGVCCTSVTSPPALPVGSSTLSDWRGHAPADAPSSRPCPRFEELGRQPLSSGPDARRRARGMHSWPCLSPVSPQAVPRGRTHVRPGGWASIPRSAPSVLESCPGVIAQPQLFDLGDWNQPTTTTPGGHAAATATTEHGKYFQATAPRGRGGEVTKPRIQGPGASHSRARGGS